MAITIVHSLHEKEHKIFLLSLTVVLHKPDFGINPQSEMMKQCPNILIQLSFL